ncbi:MAG: SnoaL-like domain [Pseudomonadota bacterium]
MKRRAWWCAAALSALPLAAGAQQQPPPGMEQEPKVRAAQNREQRSFTSKAPEKVQESLRQQTRDFETAFNAHDVRTLASYFAPEATYLDLQGVAATGKQSIREHLQEEHAGMMANARLQLTATSIRELGKDLALVDVSGVLTGVDAPAGLEVPPHLHAVVVARKMGKDWRMEALRVFPARVPGETGVGGAGTGGSGSVDPTKPEDSTATPPSGMGSSPMDQRYQDQKP